MLTSRRVCLGLSTRHFRVPLFSSISPDAPLCRVIGMTWSLEQGETKERTWRRLADYSPTSIHPRLNLSRDTMSQRRNVPQISRWSGDAGVVGGIQIVASISDRRRRSETAATAEGARGARLAAPSRPNSGSPRPPVHPHGVRLGFLAIFPYHTRRKGDRVITALFLSCQSRLLETNCRLTFGFQNMIIHPASGEVCPAKENFWHHISLL
jgi:hypothetical protein